MRRFSTGAEVLAIEHDSSPSPDFSQYHEDSKITEAATEFEVSKGTSPAKSSIKELTQEDKKAIQLLSRGSK